MRIGNAPVSWGVDYAGAPGNPPWPQVMDEIALAGYRATELGPLGYYPTDPGRLRDEFARRGLTVTAGFVFQPLHDPSRREEVLEVARRTLDLLGALGAGVLVVIDHVSEERMAVAGRPGLARRLPPDRFRVMVDLIDAVADLALARGVRPAIHQHAGCYVETEDEVEAVLAALEPERLGLCVDTGHLAYAGIDAVALFRRHAGRTTHFHFKEVDPAVHARVVAEGVPFLPATALGVFCPLGRGGFDWRALARAIDEEGYGGAATVEQDVDPAVGPSPLADARESLAYLRSVGL